MMMFSFSPTRLSRLPSMAASVRTRVVSWNDAAESHESVASDAFVMPISWARPSAASLAVRLELVVGVVEELHVDERPGQPGRVAGVHDLDASGHLAHDELDVLVVDRHTLVAVDVLDLFDEVLLGLTRTAELHHELRVERSVVQRRADFDFLAVLDEQVARDRDRLLLDLALVADDGDLALTPDELDAHRRR